MKNVKKMTELLDSGFIDTFRYFYPDAEQRYSWWSYMFKSREKNAGWRIDYFMTSEKFERQTGGCEDRHNGSGIGSLPGGADFERIKKGIF